LCATCHGKAHHDCEVCDRTGWHSWIGQWRWNEAKREGLGFKTESAELHELIKRHLTPEKLHLYAVRTPQDMARSDAMDLLINHGEDLRIPVEQVRLQIDDQVITTYGVGPQAKLLEPPMLAERLLSQDLKRLEAQLASPPQGLSGAQFQAAQCVFASNAHGNLLTSPEKAAVWASGAYARRVQTVAQTVAQRLVQARAVKSLLVIAVLAGVAALLVSMWAPGGYSLWGIAAGVLAGAAAWHWQRNKLAASWLAIFGDGVATKVQRNIEAAPEQRKAKLIQSAASLAAGVALPVFVWAAVIHTPVVNQRHVQAQFKRDLNQSIARWVATRDLVNPKALDPAIVQAAERDDPEASVIAAFAALSVTEDPKVLGTLLDKARAHADEVGQQNSSLQTEVLIIKAVHGLWINPDLAVKRESIMSLSAADAPPQAQYWLAQFIQLPATEGAPQTVAQVARSLNIHANAMRAGQSRSAIIYAQAQLTTSNPQNQRMGELLLERHEPMEAERVKGMRERLKNILPA
jgi:hypothetical protein